MRFRNPAKRTWSTSWMRSTGLEASCRFHWTQILWQGFWISPPLKPQLFHNIENKHGSAIAICTCKISVLTSKLSNSISFKKSKINSSLNDKIQRRFLLTRRRRKTCSEWENCPRGLCFPTALLSHWTEINIKQSVEFTTPHFCGVWSPVICWKVAKIHQGCSLQLQDEKRNLEPFPKPAHLASSPSTAPRYHLEPQFSWEMFKTLKSNWEKPQGICCSLNSGLITK